MLGLGLGLNKLRRGSGGSEDALNNIVSSYNFLNAWSSEKLTIVGTTTTANDYLGVHNLENPDAASQPTFNAIGSVGTNTKPSLTFDGVSHYLEKLFNDYRLSDSTGEVVSVFKYISGSSLNILSSYASGARNNFSQSSTITGVIQLQLDDLNNPPRTFINGSTNVKVGNPAIVVSFGSTGDNYYMYVNLNNETLSFLVGSNNGSCWFNEITNRLNIMIGNNSNIEWCFSGYKPYVNTTNTTDLQTELKTYYGI